MVALAERSPRLPHLLIDCEHEAFDVWPLEGVMQTLLGGVEYATSLQRAGIRTVRVTVDSNHWAMLNCAGLREAMRAQLCERGWPSPDCAVAHSPSGQDAGTAQSHGSTIAAARRLGEPRQLTGMTRMNLAPSGATLVVAMDSISATIGNGPMVVQGPSAAAAAATLIAVTSPTSDRFVTIPVT